MFPRLSTWIAKCPGYAVQGNFFHTRQAAAALLKMAKTTSDPKLAARLVDLAADLKDQAGELPPPTTRPDAIAEG
jgi:hypothetical protein